MATIERVDQRPLLYLLPGIAASQASFQPLIDVLDSDFKITVIKYGTAIDLDGFVASAAEQIPQDRSLALLAESFSGPVAVRLMIDPRFVFSHAVLCNTFARPPLKMLLPLGRLFPLALLKPNPFRDFIIRKSGIGHGGDDVWELVRERLNQWDPADLKRRVSALRTFNVESLLGRVKTPVLYLQATRDRLIHRSHGAHIAAGLPDCFVREVDGPHLLLQSAPEECAALISRHLKNGDVT